MAVYFCALSRAEDERDMGVEKQCRASIFEDGRLFACLLPPNAPALGPWRTCALGERSNSEPLNTTCTSSRPSWTTSYSTWATAGPHDLQIHLCTPYTMSTHRNTDFSAYNMFLLRDHGVERGSQARKTCPPPTQAERRTRTCRSSQATASARTTSSRRARRTRITRSLRRIARAAMDRLATPETPPMRARWASAASRASSSSSPALATV
jgi:hypothetical protein